MVLPLAAPAEAAEAASLFSSYGVYLQYTFVFVSSGKQHTNNNALAQNKEHNTGN